MKLFIYALLLLSLGANFGAGLAAENHSYVAAGVLPYAFDANGKVQFLVGLSSVHDNQASDFGGLHDKIDSYNAKRTAAREGCEELLFIFDTNPTFEKILTLRRTYKKNFNISTAQSSTYHRLYAAMHQNCCCSVSNDYIMHFIAVPYQENITALFQQRKLYYKGLLPRCWNETVQLIWVSVDQLYEAIDKRKTHGPVAIKDFNLYEPFVKSLMKARSQGIITHIKKTPRISPL
jgi:hypothetical protein